MCVQEAVSSHSCWDLTLQFSVLVLVRVGGVVSWHCLLLHFFFVGVGGISLLGGLKSMGFRTGAGPVGTKKFKLQLSPAPPPGLCYLWLVYFFSYNLTNSVHRTGLSRHSTSNATSEANDDRCQIDLVKYFPLVPLADPREAVWQLIWREIVTFIVSKSAKTLAMPLSFHLNIL